MGKRFGGLYSLARKVEKKAEKSYKVAKKSAKKLKKSASKSGESLAKMTVKSFETKRSKRSKARSKGDKFSDKATAQVYQAPKAPKYANKGLLIPAVCWLFLSLNDGPMSILISLMGCAIWVLSVWLLGEGQKAALAYQQADVAKPPLFPRKICSALLLGGAVAFAIVQAHTDFVSAALYGVVTAVLHLGAYGLDPLRSKGDITPLTFEQERVARVVEQADGHLQIIKASVDAVSSQQLDKPVSAFVKQAEAMIERVQSDPRDLTQVKKFLTVYLEGAKDASVKFSALYKQTQDPILVEKYQELLVDLQDNFAVKSQQMLENNHSDMDIEIKVLRDRLQREGL